MLATSNRIEDGVDAIRDVEPVRTQHTGGRGGRCSARVGLNGAELTAR
jgi:hypothetical protein